MKRAHVVGAAMLIAAFQIVSAQDTAPVSTVLARQQAMERMSTALGRLEYLTTYSRNPDPATIRELAEELRSITEQAFALFPSDSEKGSHARHEVWSEREGFQSQATELMSSVTALSRSASSGETATLKAKVKEIGDRCNLCDARFRAS